MVGNDRTKAINKHTAWESTFLSFSLQDSIDGISLRS